MLERDRLLWLDGQGIWPAVAETEAEFLSRAARYLSRESSSCSLSLPQCFGIAPSWISPIYSRTGLALWHGAVTWYSSLDEPPVVQMAPAFARQERWCGYRKEELLAHEALHAVRVSLQSEQYEEWFAYSHSRSLLRRGLGPLLDSSTSLWVLGGSLLGPLVAPWMPHPLVAAWCAVVPLGAAAYLALRGYRLRQQVERARQHLEQWFCSAEQVWAVLVRLTDQEIDYFAHSQPAEGEAFVKQQLKHSLRWQILAAKWGESGKSRRECAEDLLPRESVEPN